MARIGYVRTSTNKQYCDRQIAELKQHCDKIYIEDGVSARRKNRPVYKKLITQLKEGDEFIVISFDRAYRSVIEGLTSLDELTKRGVSLTSLSQRLDPTTPDGRLFFTLTIAVGEWEVNINSWRTIQGLKAAVKRGKRLGRPRKKFRYSILTQITTALVLVKLNLSQLRFLSKGPASPNREDTV